MHAKVAIPILFLFLPFGHTFLPNKQTLIAISEKNKKISISEYRNRAAALLHLKIRTNSVV